MRLRRLAVRHFSGIAAADVDFAQGLNVVHGRNELGKSSLVRAIRAALLLQDSARAADALTDWHVDAPAEVWLTFDVDAVGGPRTYRVHKRFGDRAASYLEFSRDGRTFTQEATGRAVDGALANLMNWGTEAPGGRGGPRGYAQSFISKALIGDQAAVLEILESDLGDDANDSGRRRLTSALQAMAEHPRFRQVLNAAQQKCDEAFTDTGRRRTGQQSPWTQLRNDFQLAQRRLDDVVRQRGESEGVRARLVELHAELAAARLTVAEATAELTRAEADWQAAQAHSEAEAAFVIAAAHVTRIEGLRAGVQQLDADVAAAAAEVERWRLEVAARDGARDTAVAAVDAARERVRALDSGEVEQQRRLRAQDIENRLLVIDARVQALANSLMAAAHADDVAGKAEQLRRSVAERERQINEARSLLAAAQAAFVADQEQLDELEFGLHAARYVAAEHAATEAAKVLDELQADLAAAARLDADAASLRAEVAAWQVPGPDVLAEIRRLANEQEVAVARLDVGLTLTVEPLAAVELDVTVDATPRRVRASSRRSASLEARQSIHVEVPGFGAIRVAGGNAALQAAAVAARDRFAAAVAPRFAATGATTVADLEALSRRAQAQLSAANELAARAAAVRPRREDVDAQQRALTATRHELARAATAVRERLDGDADDAAVAAAVTGATTATDALPDAASIETAMTQLRATVDGRRDLARKLEAQVSRDEGNLEGSRRELVAVGAELERVTRDLAAGWESLRADWQREQAALAAEKAEHVAELATVRDAASDAVALAAEQLAEAEAMLVAARAAAVAGTSTGEIARETLARLRGEVAARRDAADREDLPGARGRLDACVAALAALPAVSSVDATSRSEAERAVQAVQATVREKEQALHQAEGALAQVGGQYVDEQVEQARAALAAVEARERALGVEYEAWKLLRETLTAAQENDAVHLGNAFVAPVAERMSALTAGRYDGIVLGPQLRTDGVRIAGIERAYADLSYGTREQLAMLLRLSVAEALGSFIVLDDQLTQSDPERMRWLRDLLAVSSARIQVIVFTCRAEDYLGHDAGQRPMHAVDLERVVTRTRPASAPMSQPQPRPQPQALDVSVAAAPLALSPTPVAESESPPPSMASAVVADVETPPAAGQATVRRSERRRRQPPEAPATDDLYARMQDALRKKD